MMAALTAAERGGHAVTLLERQARVGRKLAATGNGRCNLSNLHCAPEAYHGHDAAFVVPALTALSVQQTRDWFLSHGLLTVVEPSGRVYPFSDQANSVVDVLRLSLASAGVQLETGCEVSALSFRQDAFFAESNLRTFAADAVIIACGGLAGEKLGGSDSGYRLLQSFGHICTPLRPALVQLKTDPALVRSLKGVRAACRITLRRGAQAVATSAGEIQFTEYGISGPVVFEISRSAASGMDAVLDLLPPLTDDALTTLLAQKVAQFPHLTEENLLTGILHNRLGRTVLRIGGVSLDTPLASLRTRELKRIAGLVKAFVLPLQGPLGTQQAQVTAGGISTGEFDPATLQSRLCPNLYACGEVLDIDGNCGGFNLQWAWSSGYLAGLLKGGTP